MRTPYIASFSFALVAVTAASFGCSSKSRDFGGNGGGGNGSGGGMGECPACDDGDPCNGVEGCEDDGTCIAGDPPVEGTPCGTGKLCIAKKCDPSTCGDGFRDIQAGEECDPPEAKTCSGTCKVIGCGDGELGEKEECEDTNRDNLDGCDATCHFEEQLRVNALSLNFGADTFCQANAVGGAIVYSASQGILNAGLKAGVGAGLGNIIFKTIGLEDPTGQTDTSFQLGVVFGKPVSGVGYSGADDLDWWYKVDPNSVDGARNPLDPMPASLSAGTLTAGPGSFTATWGLDTVTAAPLTMKETRISAVVGGATAPTLSSDGETPGHLASENVKSTLLTIETLSDGKMCGAMTALTLKGLPVPQSAVDACEGFTGENSVLDLLVSGCIYDIAGPTTLVEKTQPDGSVTGDDEYIFSADENHKVVSCTKNGAAGGTLTNCLTNATFTVYFNFTADRVILR